MALGPLEMDLLVLFLKINFVFFVLVHLAAACTWIERKGSALIQDRIGANRAGAYFTTDRIVANYLTTDVWLLKPVFFLIHWVILQPVFMVIRVNGALGVINTLVCDAVKALFKEDFIPEGTSNFVHCLAPFLAVFPIFVAFAIVPLGPNFDIGGYHVTTQVAPLNAGVLFLLAMGSMAVYGVALAGWTANNKYALLGALRAMAQMISYELAMGISIAAMIVLYGTLDLYGMVDLQRHVWGVFYQPLAFIILFVVGMAETKRGPFDLPESESELVAGYFTEYSGMKFLIFWLGEFAEIALFALIMTILFFGGWHIPFIDAPALVVSMLQAGLALLTAVSGIFGLALPHFDLPVSFIGFLVGFSIMLGKVMTLCILQIVIRWTLPRFRYDQLMDLGWKILLPLSMFNLMVTAFLKIAI
jgi:NADH-quinone oxidoreductase subunit H